ncbi:MAG: type II/IV secretion system protein [Planctomycetes bacterium]|nr:type II/IV secretion system protein [Planctomycetota bacterium]
MTSDQTTATPPIPAVGEPHRNGEAEKPAKPPTPTLTQKPRPDSGAAALLTAEQAVRLRAIPYAFEGHKLLVAMMDPTDFAAGDEVAVFSGKPVKRVGATREIFAELMRELYGITAAQMAARLGGGSAEEELVSNLEAIEADDLHRMAEQPSLINLVNLVILEAIRARASDVHVEPFEKKLAVKYRIDGVLVEQEPPPKQLQPAITSRVKIMAGMNIAERYAPQDGHISLRFEGRKIDIRVSTVPTLYGESVVMRILDKEAITLDLATLGMRERDRGSMQKLIDLPHGMALVTGPTGSGKTTTLYAALTKLYDPTLKIITIEDPVEYELSGVNQIPVNPKRGLGFADGLRSILRQDPDVIMVGEIRDFETAEISVRAALTGHLLFSTLHTNNASSAVGRLLDMGIEPFLLASVLEGVLAQRLGRKLCQTCKQRIPVPEEVRHRIAPNEIGMFEGGQAWRGAGCEKCGGKGMRGRIGFFEFMLTNGLLRQAMSRRASTMELLKLVGPEYQSMRSDGMQKAATGLTTVDEVLRATQDAEELAG